MKKNKDFEALQKDWYKKIKEDGFEDIEYFIRGEPGDWLKGTSKFACEEAALLQTPKEEEIAQTHYNATFEYYNKARALWHEESNFANEIDRAVWLSHAEGKSFREIGREVNFSHSKVMRIVDKYRKTYFNINKRNTKI